MAYKLIVTEHADKLLNNILRYLIYQLKNEQAGIHLLEEIQSIYDRLEENPLQFPFSRDTYLANRGYHEAVVGQMNYTIVFSVGTDVVNIVGIFHQLENYWKKLEI
ncbi:MAG: type II toxin-antitoxin system RelE/ParE family toxin [Lachnoclostridium sp.]|nr:type II toxin-antitoxin system RelE/ParE family toxin [Lachnospira sp.]MCM1248998.1 type II toxin-antitoxin system RelE/ParE family toxin [Lachnoclostridium sp.]MCM1535215.1 type II toxin-antitoxin system RelE/ParE family toxin [Clostridium sp.]